MYREDFKFFKEYPDMAYLDNAATTQKPADVLDAMREYYESENANPNRGMYALSITASMAYECARGTVANFIGAEKKEVIFTRNTTEGLNLVAYSGAEAFLKEGDDILVTVMEHHSNLVPWQQAAMRKGAKLRFIEVDKTGRITPEMFRNALTPKTKFVAMTHISNVLGIRTDIRTFAKMAHEQGALFVCDAAQSIPHIPVNVKELDVDFLAFSGHKMMGPMGIGVLYGRKELLEQMPPMFFGGGMVASVTREGMTAANIPDKFEAGTVNVEGAVGLAAAIEYIQKIGYDKIMLRERKLGQYLYSRLSKIPHIHVLGSTVPEEHHGIFSFTCDGVHPHDLASMLDYAGIAVRAGNHCAQPLMRHLGIPGTTRVSLAFYNTEREIDRLVQYLAQPKIY